MKIRESEEAASSVTHDQRITGTCRPDGFALPQCTQTLRAAKALAAQGYKTGGGARGCTARAFKRSCFEEEISITPQPSSFTGSKKRKAQENLSSSFGNPPLQSRKVRQKLKNEMKELDYRRVDTGAPGRRERSPTSGVQDAEERERKRERTLPRRRRERRQKDEKEDENRSAFGGGGGGKKRASH